MGGKLKKKCFQGKTLKKKKTICKMKNLSTSVITGLTGD